MVGKLRGMDNAVVARRFGMTLLPITVALVVAGCNLPTPQSIISTTSTTLPPSTTSTTGAGGTGSTSTTSSTSTTTSSTTTTTTGPTTTTTTDGSGSTGSTPSCGGSKTLVEGATTWLCTFDSEFTGTTLDLTKWVPVTTASGGYTSGQTACFMDTTNNISVGNGYLSLTAEKEAAPFTCQDPFGNFTTQYTSGSVATTGLFSQTYGRVEVMAKVPTASVAGLQSAFWLYPQNSYPSPAELDIAETFSNHPGIAVPNFHYSPNQLDANTATNTNTYTNNGCAINAGQFNDYVIEWSATKIMVSYNGKTCLVDNYDEFLLPTGTPFNQPFFINLTQALGLDSNNFDPATTPLPATTEVQYVRAWKVQS